MSKRNEEKTSCKNGHIQITSRDVEIINFISIVGFCMMPQLQKEFNIKKARSYQLIKRLIRMGLVKHERVFHFQHGIYLLTLQGANETELPALTKIPLGSYQHNIALTNLYLSLLKKYPDANWIFERQLQKLKCANGIAQPGHISDGILILTNGEHIAIEAELTFKGKIRLEKIFKNYSSQFDISEVWYFCAKNIIQGVKSVAEKMPFVKVYNIEEELGDRWG